MRVNSLQQFATWRGYVIPLDEKVCYLYVDHLRTIAAPANRAKTFVGSACLLAGVANSSTLSDITSSAR
eukprot:1840992-Amphidinium_carterae.1